MSSLFDQDRSFWRFLNKFSDIVIVNVIFIICCIPIITIGPAYSAMYYTLMKSTRRERGYFTKNYIHSFLQNCLQGIAAWMIFLVLISGSLLALYTLWDGAAKNSTDQFLFWLVVVVLFFILVMLIYFFPVLSRFEMSLKNLFVLSYLMGVRYFLNTIILIALLAVFAFVSYICLPLLILILPALYCYISTFIIEKMMAVYMVKFEPPQETESSDEEEEGELKYLGAAAKERSEQEDNSEESVEKTERKKDQWYYDQD